MKNIYLSLFVFFLTLSSYAQTDFQNNIIAGRDTTIPDAKKFQSVDLDGDGDNDLLSVSKDDFNIGWFENLDGEGSFGTYKVLVSDNSPYRNAYAADIDGDGDLDLLAILKFSESVQWYENMDGQVDFSEKQQIDADLGFGLDTVYAVDIDGDNDNDVFYSGPNTLGWNENLDGQGTFGPKQYIPNVSSEASSLVFADLDNDLDLDLLFIRYSSVLWVENLDGQGAFGPDQIITTEVDDPKSVFAADLDNDGFIDVLSASSQDGKIAWYKNINGQGNFGAQTVISIMERAVSIASADLDNDNDMDIAVIIDETTNPYSFVRLFENLDGLGNFGNMETVALTEYSTTLLLSDVDGDSNLDIIANEQIYTGYTFDDLNWFKNNGQLNNFGPKQSVIGDVRSYNSSTAFDIDVDGDLDVLATTGSGLLAYHENINGQFGPQKIIWNINGPVDVTTADLDNDGDLDILFSADPPNNQNGRIGWFENLDGFGDFGNVQDIDTDNFFGSPFVLARDIDNDGDLDVVESGKWYENTDGQGNFVSRFQGGIPADIDGDNDLDLISNQYIHKNVDGLGTFELYQTLEGIPTSQITHTDLFDFDTDGDIDIVLSSASNDKIYWYENLDGLGNYGPRLDLFNIDTVSFAKHVDLDSDGDLDIVVGSSPTNDFKLEWYERINGTNTYETPKLIANENPLDMSFFDMDLDGKIDILYISRNLAWYGNLIDDNLSVSEQTRTNVEIYPNPANNFLTIESVNNLRTINIYDVNGRKLKTIIPKNSRRIQQINIVDFPQGIYFIRAIDENKMFETHKLIKK